MNIVKVFKKSGYQIVFIGKWYLKKIFSGFDYFNVLFGQGCYYNFILKICENWEEGGKIYEGFLFDVIGDFFI